MKNKKVKPKVFVLAMSQRNKLIASKGGLKLLQKNPIV